MKKICILSTVNIKHMTIISMYTNYLDKNNIKYDIIYVDKYNEQEEINAENIYSYHLDVDRNWFVLKKLIKYYGFKKYAQKIIKDEKYDFIIVWNSFTALMFSGFLALKYKNKYCINIRDYAHEKYKLIYLIMKKVIKNSSFSTISSDGFKKFLPPYDYITVHSLNNKLLSECMPKVDMREKEKPIRITFIGYVRFFENDKKLIDALGNDLRFKIQFFGEGSQVLESYAKEKGYTNVICKGRFEPNETKRFLEQTDIINNLYGVGRIELDTALSIKLYYSSYMNIPILVFNGTYMKDISDEYGFGIVIENEFDRLGDKIYNWYRNVDFIKIREGCEKFVKKVTEDNVAFYNIMNKQFSGYEGVVVKKKVKYNE